MVAIGASAEEEEALSALALQAPVAGNLRGFSSVENLADVDRMAALALHVAKSPRRRHPQDAIPDGISVYFAQMGRITVDIGDDAKDGVRCGDPA